jgi:predicted TIM-barrel enzyme
VAFKYQAPEPQPAAAARYAHLGGFIPVTSGPATGKAPDVAKLKAMSEHVPHLGLASGISPNNAEDFVPYIPHYLVATGISSDFYHFDLKALQRLAAILKVLP